LEESSKDDGDDVRSESLRDEEEGDATRRMQHIGQLYRMRKVAWRRGMYRKVRMTSLRKKG
jgi:hypothetical protein